MYRGNDVLQRCHLGRLLRQGADNQQDRQLETGASLAFNLMVRPRVSADAAPAAIRISAADINASQRKCPRMRPPGAACSMSHHRLWAGQGLFRAA